MEEAGLTAAVRATHEREWPIGDVRQHALGHEPIVVEQLLLGDALLRVQHLVRMGDRVAVRRPGLDVLCRFHLHLARGFVLAQTLKRGVS